VPFSAGFQYAKSKAVFPSLSFAFASAPAFRNTVTTSGFGLVKAAKQLLASGVPPRDVAKNLDVSVLTLYRWVLASSRP